MNNHKELSKAERLAAMRRHPSLYGETVEQLATDEGTTQLLEHIAHVHDFFRYGDPDAIDGLEHYLHEAGTGLHAEVLLDEVGMLTAAAALRLRSGSNGVAR